MIDKLLQEAEELISKESWKFSNVEVDRLITLIDEIFDLNIKSQEDNDVRKMKQDNIENGEFIMLKENTEKKYTDKSAQAFLDGKYEKENIEILKTKYKCKVVDNKLKLLQEKLLLVKKYLSVN